MSSHESSIVVDRPVRQVYNQWTQFQSFPEFMDGVDEVDQTTETRTHWKTSIAGVTREFDAEVTEQTPDQRIAWKSTDGTSHAGVVTFHRVDDSQTKIMLQMDIDPEGLAEKAADLTGILGHQVKSDLENFKKFIEDQPAETGAWRGEVPQDPTA